MAGLRPFSELKCISKQTLEVIDSLGFKTATPVQEATIPLFCGNKDVAVDASTGSGKTLAFVIPVIEKLRRLDEKLKPHQLGAVIVSPTRELAKQIHAVAAPFVASVPRLSSLLLVGGTDPAEDVAAFKAAGGNILVGTPGRLHDVMKRLGTALDTRKLEVLVLDEADRLLDMGFRVQLDAIMARLPKQRRTGLFSATQTEAVEALARAGLRNPVKVAVAVTAAPAAAAAADDSFGKKRKRQQDGEQQQGGAAAAAGGAALEQKTPTSLSLEYIMVSVEQKLPQLVAFLDAHRDSKVIVYFLTCACVEHHALLLKRLPQLKGLQVQALHGKLKQAAREATLSKYSGLPSGVLLCTDVAARGLDIPDVSWIVQYDPPQDPAAFVHRDPAAFVHRVGRTARMGRSGSALALLLPNESSYVEFLRLRKVPLVEAQLMEGAPDAAELSALLRKEAESDREVMEKATRAFVSFVRGYKEHHCKFVFRLQELPLGPLAVSLGLLKLPRMPEVKKGSAANALDAFTPSAVDPDSVKFQDKQREKQRQQMLKQKQQQAAAAGGKQPQKQKQQAAAAGAEPGARLTAAKRRQLQARDELAELQHDYSMLRKLKKGKISEHAFDVATGLSSDSGDDEDDVAAAAAAVKAGGRRAVAAAAAADSGSEGGGSDDEGAEHGQQLQQQQAAKKQQKGEMVPPERSVVHRQQQLRKRKKRRQQKRQAAGAGAS
ncbi:hypothetical protein OEZ85_000576 [Tetradesmus obliquus]|uniref:ATP-dependent RNA helicase n=1 Tax=Tetradesmus obliquus TaxID=3088 RepID=A0ABY8UJ18_TETOB|nr:hypothetical protein OEZ85_000576 [Tetradesmus obliquus]